MKLNRFDNAQQYYERVKNYLLQHEAHHNLLFSISNTLIHSPDRFTEKPYLVTVEENEKVLVVALMTPPYKLVLSRSLKLEALRAIAQDIYLSSEPLPGVIGLDAEAKTFVKEWQALTNQPYKKGMAQRIYQLEAVKPISTANGYFRLATTRDHNLLVNWRKAFTKEAIGDAVDQDAASFIDRCLSDNVLYIWQNNLPVSVASYGGATPNGVRIRMVYTPPE